jgi:hypothetical protein
MGLVQHWQLLRVVKRSTYTPVLVLLQGGSSSNGGLCSPMSGASHRSAKLAALPATVASLCTSGNEVLAAAFAAQAMDGGEEAAPSGPGPPAADAMQDAAAHGFQQGSSPAAQQADGQQQQSGPAPVTGLDVCSDSDGVPAGIAGPMPSGECLYHHPARPINVPCLQVSTSCLLHLPCRQLAPSCHLHSSPSTVGTAARLLPPQEAQVMTEDMQLEVEAALSSLGQ